MLTDARCKKNTTFHSKFTCRTNEGTQQDAGLVAGAFPSNGVVMDVRKWHVQRLALASERHAAFNEMRVCPKANYTWVTCTASSPLTCCTFR